MPHLTLGTHQLEYVWHGPGPGDAPTLVFLHEGLGSVGMWRDFPERVVASTGLGALVYSRAGYGSSDPIDLPRPVRFMHDEALIILPGVLKATGVRQRFWSDTATVDLSRLFMLVAEAVLCSMER